MSKVFKEKTRFLFILPVLVVTLQPCAYGEIQLKEPKTFEESRDLTSATPTTSEPLNLEKRLTLTSALMTEPTTLTKEEFDQNRDGRDTNGGYLGRSENGRGRVSDESGRLDQPTTHKRFRVAKHLPQN